MSAELRNLELFCAEADQLIAYVGHNNRLADLLYRCDLLPEQVEAMTRDWGRMLILISVFRELEEETS